MLPSDDGWEGMQVVGIPGDLCDVARQWILRKRLVALTADARLITFCCGWSFLPIVGRHWLWSALGELRSITAPLPIGERGILRWACLSVCVCVCLSVRDHISGTTRPISSPIFCKMLQTPVCIRRASLYHWSSSSSSASFITQKCSTHNTKQDTMFLGSLWSLIVYNHFSKLMPLMPINYDFMAVH